MEVPNFIAFSRWGKIKHLNPKLLVFEHFSPGLQGSRRTLDGSRSISFAIPALPLFRSLFVCGHMTSGVSGARVPVTSLVSGTRVPVTSPACGPNPKKYLKQDPCCLAGEIDHCLVRLKASKPLDLNGFDRFFFSLERFFPYSRVNPTV